MVNDKKKSFFKNFNNAVHLFKSVKKVKTQPNSITAACAYHIVLQKFIVKVVILDIKDGTYRTSFYDKVIQKSKGIKLPFSIFGQGLVMVTYGFQSNIH